MPVPDTPAFSRPAARQFGLLLAVCAVYVLAAKLGLRLAFVNPSATAVWPPTGIALAALLLLGPSAWPAVFAGAFLANLTTAGTVWTSLGIATGNTLEAVVGAALVSRYAGGARAFQHAPHIVRFAVLEVLVATPISATIGVTTLVLGGLARWTDFGPVWLTWWLGDAAGALVVAPLLLLWAEREHRGLDRRALLERVGFLAALLIVGGIVFSGLFAFAFLVLPFPVWAAFRFGRRETAAIIVLMAAIAIWGTLQGAGPFVAATRNASLLLLQVFMTTITLVALPLASVVSERNRATAELLRRMTAEQAAREAAERAAERTARLQSITAALSAALTPEQVADVIVRETMAALDAQAAAVSLLVGDGGGGELEILSSAGYPEDILRRWQRFPPEQVPPIADALRAGEVVWHAAEQDLAARFPEREPLPDGVGRGGRAAVPLMLRGRAAGVLYINFRDPRTFDADDTRFMLTLGRQCAQAVERARLYSHERHVATTLQRALLPTEIPSVPGLMIDAFYQPSAPAAEVGGDWYDVFRLPDGRIVLSIGDVVGRGLEAAVVMGQMRQAVRAAALEGHAPAAALMLANRVLGLSHEDAQMTTVLVGVLDPITSSFVYASAGHPAPAMAVPGRPAELLLPGGPPLGFFDSPPPTWTVHLAPGSLLVLYTDGLIEGSRDISAGQAALLESMQREADARSPHIARGIVDHVLGAAGPAADDVAVIAVALAPGPLEQLDVTLPATPASLRLVRHAVRQLAHGLHLDEQHTFGLTVAIGEAVNNVVEHAYGGSPGEFRLHIYPEGRRLQIEIEDHGRWRPARRESDGGRGVHLMRQLADTVAVATGELGTVVRMTISLDPGGRAASPPAEAAPAGDGSGTEPRPATSSSPTAAGGGPPPDPGRVWFADAPGGLAVDVGEEAGVTVVSLGGDLDLAGVGRFTRVMEEAAASTTGPVILSLAGVSYFDSQGVQALLRIGARLTTGRRTLALVIPASSPLRRLFETIGLGASFPIYASVADAVAAGPAPGA